MAIGELHEFRAQGADASQFLAAHDGFWFDVSLDRSADNSPRTRFPSILDEGEAFRDNRWRATTIANSFGVNFLVACSSIGAHPPIRYRGGEHWQFAGVSVHPDFQGDETERPAQLRLQDLIGCVPFKNRLWWWEREGTRVWYGDIYSPGGELSPFYLSGVADAPGRVVDIGQITRDGGDGPDDYIAFYFSTGHVAVYQGTDPDSAADFGLVGTFFIGVPLGDRPFVQYSGDLLALSDAGLISISRVMSGEGLQRADFTAGLNRENWFAAIRRYGRRVGWQGVIPPGAHKLIINVPSHGEEGDEYGPGTQFVLNLLTGAWCTYRGWDAGVWGVFGDRVYYGHRTLGQIYEADVEGVYYDVRPTQREQVVNIPWAYYGPFNHLPSGGAGVSLGQGAEAYLKRATYLIPRIESHAPNPFRYQAGVQVDHETTGPTQAAGFGVDETTRFTRSTARPGPARARKVGVRGTGRALAPVLRALPADLGAEQLGAIRLWNTDLGYVVSQRGHL